MKRWEWITLGAVVLAWAVNLPPWMAEPIGRWEGQHWPVAERLNVVSAEEMADGWTEIFVHVEKLRDCEYLDMRWFLGTPDARSAVQFHLDSPARIRPSGSYDIGPWMLQLGIPDLMSYQTEDGFRSATYAESYHRCPLFRLGNVTVHRPWPTITQIWPGVGDDAIFIRMQEAP